MAKTNLPSPRELAGAGAMAPGMPMPPTKMPTPGKHKAKPQPKLVTKMPAIPKNIPKPRTPAKLKPLLPAGPSNDVNSPTLPPRISPKGVKQQVPLDVPGVKTL